MQHHANAHLTLINPDGVYDPAPNGYQDKLMIFADELQRMLGAATKPACTLIPAPRLALDGMLF